MAQTELLRFVCRRDGRQFAFYRLTQPVDLVEHDIPDESKTTNIRRPAQLTKINDVRGDLLHHGTVMIDDEHRG